MGGANYMGGKRNAMKARARDQVSRKQKGFFKRKKLDMLAKGLSGSLEPTARSSHWLATKVGSGSIELAHAHTKHRTGPVESTGTRSFIPSPDYVSSTSSFPRKRRRTGDAHISSPSLGFLSEILINLDKSEPLFLRKAMDQILAMPDLAGLGQRVVSKQRKQTTQTRRSERRPESTFGMANHSTGSSRVKEIEMVPSEDISDWDTPCEYDGSNYDSGYENNLEEESIASDWSIYQSSSHSSTRRHDGGKGTIDFPHFQEQNPHVKAARRSVFIRDDGGTIYGKLFEDPDPWRRIGIILGLEKEDEVGQRAAGAINNTQFDTSSSRESQKDVPIHIISEACGDEAVLAEHGVGPVQVSEGEHEGQIESGAHREGSPEVLAMLQLQEVNGKFLAPSIGFEWESEED